MDPLQQFHPGCPANQNILHRGESGHDRAAKNGRTNLVKFAAVTRPEPVVAPRGTVWEAQVSRFTGGGARPRLKHPSVRKIRTDARARGPKKK